MVFSKRLVKWEFNRLVLLIVQILLEKFDCFIVIEGERGIGKSTLGYRICRSVAKKMAELRLYMRKNNMQLDFELKDKDYKFRPEKDMLFSREEVMNFYADWHRIGVADEMINVSFNRDFYDERQKDLIKEMNMNRDHGNVLVACVPQFQNIDNQVKNLCKIRITVVRRGIAIIHTKNRTIYSKDKWDTQVNEKIEREWLMKGTKNPKYARLTTVRGFFVFPDLSEKEKALYLGVKDEKRNRIMTQELGINVAQEKDPVDEMIERLEGGKIKNMQVIEGFALANNIKLSSLQDKIRRKLKDQGKNSSITDYFWGKKDKFARDQEEHEGSSALRRMINRIKSQGGEGSA